jgi:hypothetical protein
MFVQEAARGTLTATADKTYQLVLSGVSSSTIYFSDRPQTIAGNVGMGEFVSKFDWGGFSADASTPPNAAIVLKLPADPAQDTWVVQLTAPEYDPTANTLAYTVKALPLTGVVVNTSAFTDFIGRADEGLPAEFDEVSLFIDSCGRCKAHCYGPYWISGSQACRSRMGDIGKVSCCWSWQSFSCSPCHDYLDRCKAGPCNCSGSCKDPHHPGWTACGTSEDCMGDPNDAEGG